MKMTQHDAWGPCVRILGGGRHRGNYPEAGSHRTGVRQTLRGRSPMTHGKRIAAALDGAAGACGLHGPGRAGAPAGVRQQPDRVRSLQRSGQLLPAGGPLDVVWRAVPVRRGQGAPGLQRPVGVRHRAVGGPAARLRRLERLAGAQPRRAWGLRRRLRTCRPSGRDRRTCSRPTTSSASIHAESRAAHRSTVSTTRSSTRSSPPTPPRTTRPRSTRSQLSPLRWAPDASSARHSWPHTSTPCRWLATWTSCVPCWATSS